MNTKSTTNQLVVTPTRMPNTRASWIDPPPPNMVGESSHSEYVRPTRAKVLAGSAAPVGRPARRVGPGEDLVGRRFVDGDAVAVGQLLQRVEVADVRLLGVLHVAASELARGRCDLGRVGKLGDLEVGEAPSRGRGRCSRRSGGAC